MRARIYLWDTSGSLRGRGKLVAMIDDAANVGVLSVANGTGNCHFTLPYDHPQIGQCLPRLRHYRISRFDSKNVETTVGVGMLDDYDASENDVIFYGIDYLGLFERSISASNTSYTSQDVGTVIQTEASLAVTQGGTVTPWAPGPNAVLGFIQVGSFDLTGLTPASLLTSYQPRLQFIQSLINTWAGSNATPVRPLFSITRDPPFVMSFSKSTGTDQLGTVLDWGGSASHFRYVPGYASLRTQVYGIGQKRDGATLLYSHQTGSALEATYGISQQPTLHIDVVDQPTLDNLVKHDARVASRIGLHPQLSITSGSIPPWSGFGLLDSVPVSISRGIVGVRGALYTIGSLEWTCLPNGAEQTVFGLYPKDV